MAEKSSREKVAELKAKGKSAKEIAEALSMSPANVYAHFRKIDAETGAPKRGRGRPPKVQTEGNGSTEKTEKSTTDEKPKASRPAPGRPKGSGKSTNVQAESNGHTPDYFAHTVEGLDQDLAEARKRVTMLEKMRVSLVGSDS